MESSITLPQLIELIKSLGFGALFGAGLLSCIYLTFCLITHSTPTIDYVYVILISGALLGSGVQGILVSINRYNNRLKESRIDIQIRNENRLKEAETNRRIAEEDIYSLQRLKKSGCLIDDQFLKKTDTILDNWILSNQETESTNRLKSEEQRQIPPS